jgi:hypothetical protein
MDIASKLPARQERLVQWYLRNLKCQMEPKIEFARGARRLAGHKRLRCDSPGLGWPLASERLRPAADGASSPAKASLRRRSASTDRIMQEREGQYGHATARLLKKRS